MIKNILSIVTLALLMVNLTSCGPSQEELNKLRILEINQRNNKIYDLVDAKIKEHLGNDSFSRKLSIKRLSDTLIFDSIYSSKYLNFALFAQVDSFYNYYKSYENHKNDIKETLYLISGNYRAGNFHTAQTNMENDYNKIKYIYDKFNKISTDFSKPKLMGYFSKYISQLQIQNYNRNLRPDTMYFIVDTLFSKIKEYSYVPFGADKKDMMEYFNYHNNEMLNIINDFENTYQNKTLFDIREALENNK